MCIHSTRHVGVYAHVQRIRSGRTTAVLSGPEELSCGLRVKGLTSVSWILLRGFSFLWWKTMCNFYNVNFLLKTRSGFTCKRAEIEDLFIQYLIKHWEDTEETRSHVNTYPHTQIRACIL